MISHVDDSMPPLDRAHSPAINPVSIESAVPDPLEGIPSLPDPTAEFDFASEWTSGSVPRLSGTSENAFRSERTAAFFGGVTSETDYPYATGTTDPGPSGRQDQTAAVSQASFRSSDALEAQPSTSVGYEWDEWSPHSRQDRDGYASLSIDAEGKGYLGEFHNGISSSRGRLCIRIDCPPYTANMCQIHFTHCSGRINVVHNR